MTAPTDPGSGSVQAQIPIPSAAAASTKVVAAAQQKTDLQQASAVVTKQVDIAGTDSAKKTKQADTAKFSKTAALAKGFLSGALVGLGAVLVAAALSNPVGWAILGIGLIALAVVLLRAKSSDERAFIMGGFAAGFAGGAAASLAPPVAAAVAIAGKAVTAFATQTAPNWIVNTGMPAFFKGVYTAGHAVAGIAAKVGTTLSSTATLIGAKTAGFFGASSAVQAGVGAGVMGLSVVGLGALTYKLLGKGKEEPQQRLTATALKNVEDSSNARQDVDSTSSSS